ncbi:HdeD family acid-resistance protein [Dactylosporangium sp. CA-139066]|uniref:HdeD family acid-resistance protein n=1 Tax=Dactylosporangium sp. CA-139066 TaxID=3239930 RepID=UPI003D9039D6
MSSVSGHAGQPAARVAHEVAVPFWRLIGVGAVTVLFGLAVLAWPHATLRLLGILAGVWLLAIGLLRVGGAFRAGPDEAGHHVSVRQVIDAAFGLLLAVVGIACLVSASAGVVTVSVLIGLAWMLSGFAAMLLGTFAAGPTRSWLLGMGTAAVVVGLVFLFWPGVSLQVLVLLTGIAAVAFGIAEIAIAISARRALTAR